MSLCPKKTLRQTALLAVTGAFCLGTAFAQSEKLILPDDTDPLERPGARPNLLERGFDSLNKRSSVGGVVELPSNSPITTPNSRNKSGSSFDLFGKEGNWIYNSFDDDRLLSAESALGVTWLGTAQTGKESDSSSFGNEDFFGDKSKNSRNPNRSRTDSNTERTDLWQQGGSDSFRSAFGDNKENIFGLDRKTKQGANREEDTSGDLFGNRSLEQKSPFENAFEANSPFGERPPSSVGGVFNKQNLFSPEAKILRDKELLKKSEFQKLLNPHSSIAPVTAGFDPLGSLQVDALRQEVNPITPKGMESLTMPKASDPWSSFRDSNALRPRPQTNPFEDFATRNALPGSSAPALMAPAASIMKPQPGVLEWPKAPR